MIHYASAQSAKKHKIWKKAFFEEDSIIKTFLRNSAENLALCEVLSLIRREPEVRQFELTIMAETIISLHDIHVDLAAC